VLVNDSEIQALNAQFLQRNYPTDVIAFPLGDNHGEIWGEIYISMDRVKEQASMYHVSLTEEFIRLIIHGILHLIGYDDRTKMDRIKMKKRENYYLNLFRCDCSEHFINC
jgi:probable rRNA maturation factor